MKLIHRTKKIIITAFLLSLLFHASSILYIVVRKTDQPNPNLLREREEALKQKFEKEEEWAETKARVDNFGAPVMFEDLPDEDVKENTMDNVENAQPTKDDTKPDREPAKKAEEENIEKTVPEKIITQERNVSFDASSYASLSRKASEDPRKAMAERPVEKKNPPIKKNPLPKQRSLQRKKDVPAPKPPLSLAQLTQGFLNHVKDEGTHAIHMLGKKNGRPSDEQIKYERYLQKLSWCLQNSFNINNDRIPASAITESTVYIMLALNKDGTMRHCNVAKTSGDTQLDRFTLFIFNDASTSFPPVPTYLPHDPFTITYVITHNIREQNSMRLYRR